MKADIETQVREFAKANKINQAKLVEFVNQIIPKTSSGRPVTQNALAVREALQAKLAQRDGQFTVKDLADDLESDPVTINNAMHYFKNKGIVTPAGTVANHTGRGRKPVLWVRVIK